LAEPRILADHFPHHAHLAPVSYTHLSLLFSVDSADAAPTKQQYEVEEDLEKEAQPLLTQYRELISKDLTALNDMVSKQNIPVLYVPAGK